MTGAVSRRGGWDLWILAVLFLVSLPAITPRIYASDEVEYFAYLRSWWFDRDLSFENEYRYFYEHGGVQDPGFRETFLGLRTETGLRINFAPVGCAILWSPFYAAADAGVRIARAAGYDVAADGFSPPYIAAAAYGSAAYGFLALILSRWIATRVVGHGLAATIVVWLGTPLLFYMYIAPPMSHACSAFAVAAFIATWLRVGERWSARGLVALGGLAALMTMVREQDGFFAIGPAIDFGWTWLMAGRPAATGAGVATSRGRLLLNALAGVATALVCIVPQLFAYVTLNGHPGPSRLVARKMSWSAPHAWDVISSPAYGFLVWTPLAAVALCGLVWFGVRVPSSRRVVICMLAMVALQVYVAGSVGSWTVAGAFGQRRFVALTAVLAVGVAGLLELTRRGPARLVTWATLVLAICWNIGLAVQFGAGMMDRQRLDPVRSARTTFVVLPVEGPRLVWRYLWDRSSFYKSHRPGRDDRR